MSKQLFLQLVPQSLLYDILEKVSEKTDKYYIIDINTYKRIKFYELSDTFIQTFLPYYKPSKKFYLERDFTYNSFTNVIRQICKSNSITFTSKIKYHESSYNIEYYVYYGTETETETETAIEITETTQK